MASLAIASEDKTRIIVAGELGFSSVPAAYSQIIALFDQVSTLCIDLRDVQRVDSAALALLLELLQEANRRGQTLSIVQVPAQLIALAKVSGLESLLPLRSFSNDV